MASNCGGGEGRRRPGLAGVGGGDGGVARARGRREEEVGATVWVEPDLFEPV